MTPETLLEILCIAANARTKEEKARLAWRFSDAMWRRIGHVPMGFARSFNNLLQGEDWPWISDLWSKDEIKADYTRLGLPNGSID